MIDNDTPAECADCRSVPHDTLCDACGRLVCYGCSFDDDGARLCTFCHADRCEEHDSTDAGSYEVDSIDPELAAAIDEHVTRPPPECRECGGLGLVPRPAGAPVREPTDADRCPACNPPEQREPLQDGTGCDV